MCKTGAVPPGPDLKKKIGFLGLPRWLRSGVFYYQMFKFTYLAKFFT